MSTTVSFAVNLAEVPELLCNRDGKPFLTCRAQNDEGEWGNDVPTPRNVKAYGSAANHVHDSCGSGDRILVRGVELTESWPGKQTGENRTKTGVIIDNRFGEIGVSLKSVSARIERIEHPAAPAAG